MCSPVSVAPGLTSVLTAASAWGGGGVNPGKTV